jgi:hypothetical protein
MYFPTPLPENFGKCHMAEYAGDYGSNSAVRAEEDVQLEMNKEKTMRQIGKRNYYADFI